MKKTILSLILMASFSGYASDYFDKPARNYFPERSEITQSLNEDIRRLGGIDKIEMLVERKDATSNYIIGQMIRLGIGYEQSAEHAYKYFKVASENGDAKGSYYLGMLVLNEDPLISLDDNESTEKSIKEGLNLIKLSAEKGYTQGQYLLGKLYIKGYYLPKNYNLAMFWLSKAASHGHDMAYSEKVQLKKNNDKYKRSFEETRMKMIHGSLDAMVDMAKIYIEGYLLPQDYKKAYELLLSASRLGNNEATSILVQLEESYSDRIK